MPPTPQTTPQVLNPAQAAAAKPSATTPSNKAKRSLKINKGKTQGAEFTGKTQKDNNSSAMEVKGEKGLSGDDTVTDDNTDKTAPERSKDNVANAGTKSPPGEEQSGEWASKAAEASKIAQAKANKSPLAKRLSKKDAGLKGYGFCASKASSAETARGAAGSTNAAPGEKLLRRGQFPHRQYCYLDMDL